MSDIYYSATNNGFYHVAFREIYEASANGWPDDAIAVSAADYENLLQGQSAGRIITTDSDGQPILTDPVIDWQERAEQQRKNHIATANETTADWRTELQLGVISDDEKSALVIWMAYIRALKSLDLSAVDSEAAFDAVEWPAMPE
ncbi:tail fiber assembly protein [Pantoea agglomerans]|uniref:tail fiber assembly protein n=1 Tax=Enterobacter agglomerans TaxID=549 RepID=UPI0032091BD4